MSLPKKLVSVALTLGLMVFAAIAGGELSKVPFSAKMIQRGPDGTTTTGRMYVDDGRMRIEMSQQGRTMVRITDQGRRTEWILFPDQQRYIEHQVPAETAAALGTPAPDETPCSGIPGLVCKNLGDDTIDGRPVTKWEMTATHQGQRFTTTQWIDKERGLPLLQELPNGQRTELKFVGEETLHGRAVEKWETVVTAPSRPASRTFQWYDPKLRLAIKQELPGGIVHELRDIEVGDQPDELFSVPQDYERLTPNERMGMAPSPETPRR